MTRNDPGHEADERYGTPCLVCGAPIIDGKGHDDGCMCGEKVCPRCDRPTTGWLLRRPDVCSPSDWARCIRQPRPEWVTR